MGDARVGRVGRLRGIDRAVALRQVPGGGATRRREVQWSSTLLAFADRDFDMVRGLIRLDCERIVGVVSALPSEYGRHC